MSVPALTRPQRRVVATAIAIAMAGALGAVSIAPAGSAEPGGDCKVAFPQAEVVKDQPVTGLTVSEGTTPDGFTGAILGTIEDGIAPGLDMIMARLTSPEIDRVGIWQGMSGSPVYAEDGRLIGAVAYGLAWGPSPVAGITPFEEMDDYLGPAPAARVKVSEKQARTIAANSEVSQNQAEQGFRQLPMPMGYTGISQARLDMDKKGRTYFTEGAQRAAGTSSSAAGPESIVAGGNLAVALSYGDITAGGVGTATSVCNGRVVGFGHPATFMGRTSLGLMPADAVYVQEDPAGPGFKVANMGAPAGIITDDRTTGVTGTFGPAPETTTVTSEVTYGARNRVGSTDVFVKDVNADIAFNQILANHDRVLDGFTPGSALMDWSIRGTNAAGAPFEVGMTDRYAGTDVAFATPWDVADMTWLLSGMEGVLVDTVESTSVVTDDSAGYRLVAVDQFRNQKWKRVTKETPARLRAGDWLTLRAVLKSATGYATVPLSFKTPGRAAGSVGRAFLTGGQDYWPEFPNATTPEGVGAFVDSLVRNDAVQGELYIEAGRRPIVRNDVTDPTSRVVSGTRRIKVLFR